jgi:hypothetical protein
MALSGGRAYPGPALESPPVTNLDLLQWFSEEERNVCSSCGQQTCVSLPDAAAHFCLACGAIHISGMRLDVGRTIPV